MPLTISAHLSQNDFEADVARMLSRLHSASEVPYGYLTNNVLLPRVEHRRPDEHDNLLLLPWAGYTIDAKAYMPGNYHIPANSPIRWQDNVMEEIEGNWVRSRLPHPSYVCKQKGSVLNATCKKAVPRLADYPIESIVVVPDKAEFVCADPDHPADLPVYVRVLNLRDLVPAILKDAQYPWPGTRASDNELGQVFRQLEALPHSPSVGGTYDGVRIIKGVDRTEPGCPVRLTAYEGMLELAQTDVEVRFYAKYPWSDQVERFMRHARRRLHALLKTRHANVVAVLRYDDQPDVLVVAYQNYNGRTLRDEVTQRIRFSPGLVRSLVRHIAVTVQHLHEGNIIHLDLRPEHVLLGPGLEQHGGSNHLLVGFTNPLMDDELPSTAAYGEDYEKSFAAPEMTAPGSPQRGKPTNDIFSLGRLALYCLLGEQEYRRRAAVKKGLDTMSGLDADLDDLIKRATRYFPAERPQSCREVVSSLA
jgi:hypothetical protein